MKPPRDYPSLLRQVKATLIEGQRRIEAERVKTYWETGQLIHAHILKHKDRAVYGTEVFKRLERDLNVDLSVLQRCVQFAKTYPRLPNSAGQRNFNWGHYQKLITISDDKKRVSFERAVRDKGWSAEELAERLKEERSSDHRPSAPQPVKSRAPSHEPLTPLRGIPYTYQIIDRPDVKSGKSGLRLDLGFGVFHKDPAIVAGFAKGDIVASTPAKQESSHPSERKRSAGLPPVRDGFKLYKTDRTVKDLFTYWAEVEKIIDGDTLKVRFDLGFNVEARDTLRLRGIDCPEMSTKEGQSAKIFVQSYIKESDVILVRSSRSDKYARYLADIFIQRDGEDDIFLNNLLLEKGHAVRWE